MGRHPLGGDRSVRLVSGHAVWEVLGPAVAGRTDVVAAVPSVGADADRLLPLGRGCTLVVNASPEALQRGTTDPGVLVRWQRAGVQIHSLATLNATLVLASGTDPFLATGSADAAPRSAPRMFEAALITDLPEVLEDARQAFAALLALAGDPLTGAQLLELENRYATEPAPRPRAATVVPSETRAPVTRDVRPAAERPSVERAAGAAGGAAGTPADAGSGQSPEVELDAQPVELPWPRPRTVYLLGWTGPAPVSERARERLAEWESDLGLRASPGGVPTVEGRFALFPVCITENLGSDRPFGLPVPTGAHVVLVTTPAKSAPRPSAQVESPARVMGSWVDEAAYPRQKYYFLVGRHHAPRRTLRDVNAALQPLGAKASFLQAYMTSDKVQAMLDLWPGAEYDA
ncbi:hypothetical protein [Nakamurella deserti]|uniref:hypothetical protein n=1 Tax=Nakamurella deserti TaxID=2164074 RepID=UPI000DBE14B4|nr:hypothetical protein [Nakamurella deserti]